VALELLFQLSYLQVQKPGPFRHDLNFFQLPHLDSFSDVPDSTGMQRQAWLIHLIWLITLCSSWCEPGPKSGQNMLRLSPTRPCRVLGF
jgi:hypothetical protein